MRNVKPYIIAVIIAVAIALAWALAPAENCEKRVAGDDETLTCSECGRVVTMTFDGLCDLCYGN